jgi:hypothetical protein
MLHPTVGFVVLVVCAVLGGELRNALARRGFRAPSMEGLSFLMVGLALGQQGLGLFAVDILATLRAVVLLGLAWIGLAFGLQIELRVIRHLRPWHRMAGILMPVMIGATIGTSAWFLGEPPASALGLAAVGMISSPSTLEGLARGRLPADRSALRLLKLVMAWSGLPAVVLLAVATTLWSPISHLAGGPVPAWYGVLVVLGAGLVAGYALLVFLQGARTPITILTVAIGVAAVLAGATAMLGASALPAAAVAGFVVINRLVMPHRVLKVVHSLEGPMLVALLVLVGASWSGIAFSWKVLALMVGVRGCAAILAGQTLARVAGLKGSHVETPFIGMGLLPQGELALGVLVALIGTLGAEKGVLEAVVMGMIVNQVLGQWWMRHHLFEAPTIPAAP